MGIAPHLHRRDFLRGASCAGAALACARFLPSRAIAAGLQGDARIAATPFLDKGFAATRKIGSGVYATLADTSRGLEALCNGGFIAGRDAALIIEGHNTPAGAAHELEALRMVSQAPVLAALNSHYHFDHSFGNAYFGAQQIPVMAHAQVGPLMVEKYAIWQARGTAQMLEPLERQAAAQTDAMRRQRAQGDLQAAQVMAQSLNTAVLALPNRPLEPGRLPMKLDLGGITAVIEAYPGHTPSDIVVRVPEQNIVFTGDLLFNGSYPVAFDAAPVAWIRTLETFAGFGRETLFVPGHGALCGQEGIAQERAVLEDLVNFALKMKKAGVPAEEAQQRYEVPEKFKSLGYFSWGFCIGSAIARAYAEL